MTDTSFNGRLRYLLDDPRKEIVCLSDVVSSLVACTDPLSKLEYKNTKHSLVESKKALKQAKRKLIDFELRLKNEVTEEVAEEKAKNPKEFNTKKNEGESLWD